MTIFNVITHCYITRTTFLQFPCFIVLARTTLDLLTLIAIKPAQRLWTSLSVAVQFALALCAVVLTGGLMDDAAHLAHGFVALNVTFRALTLFQLEIV